MFSDQLLAWLSLQRPQHAMGLTYTLRKLNDIAARAHSIQRISVSEWAFVQPV